MGLGIARAGYATFLWKGPFLRTQNVCQMTPATTLHCDRCKKRHLKKMWITREPLGQRSAWVKISNLESASVAKNSAPLSISVDGGSTKVAFFLPFAHKLFSSVFLIGWFAYSPLKFLPWEFPSAKRSLKLMDTSGDNYPLKLESFHNFILSCIILRVQMIPENILSSGT